MLHLFINGKLVLMKVLITNDDGIFAETLWTLANTFKNNYSVSVVAPDREQSATGTMVTLRLPLRVREHNCFSKDIATFSVEGSPADSVILAIGKIVPDTGMVVSGINQGLNLGDDVLISGTVGAAMQGYLRGLPAIAVSVPPDSGHETRQTAARVAEKVALAITNGMLGTNGFFNINVPNVPVSSIRGIKATRLAHKTHIDTVEEGHDGRREYYWLVRRQLTSDAAPDTDIWAIDNAYISITPLHSELFHRPDGQPDEGLCADLFNQIINS